MNTFSKYFKPDRESLKYSIASLETLKLFHVLLILLLISGGNLFAQDKFRTEVDLLGEIKVPADAYYGAETARAMENFQISNRYINDFPNVIKALAMVKLAAARANTDAGKMSADMLKLIEPACQELIKGNYLDQFKIDIYQGGAGTSTNMNANEVLANIALEKAGYKKGEYNKISPHNHINMSQSTNDVYPTALKLTLLLYNDLIIKQFRLLAQSFRKLGDKYIHVVKMGRTEFQDAVPMTVGQEFHSFASMLEWNIANIEYASKSLMILNMGGHGYWDRVKYSRGL